MRISLPFYVYVVWRVRCVTGTLCNRYIMFQALNGFMFTVTCQGEVFFASRTVEQYLGFHQVSLTETLLFWIEKWYNENKRINASLKVKKSDSKKINVQTSYIVCEMYEVYSRIHILWSLAWHSFLLISLSIMVHSLNPSSNTCQIATCSTCFLLLLFYSRNLKLEVIYMVIEL